MKRFLLGLCLVWASVAGATWGPPATQVSIPTNAAVAWGLTVQSALNYLATNSVFVSSGYMTTSNAILAFAGLTSDNAYSANTTQKLYEASVYNAGTTNQVRLGTFYGFTASMTAGQTQTGTASYISISNLTAVGYNPQAQFDSVSRYTPTAAGYYRVGVTLAGTGTSQIPAYRTTNTAFNIPKYEGDTNTNGFSSGSAIVYMNGTYDFLEFSLASIRGSGIVTSLVVNAEYVGK